MAPWVLHVDLDQFIAAVEVLRRPELSGMPLIVGGRGDARERAVVSTASYEARAFGVRSGMPLKIAVRKCPQAVLLPVDAPIYQAASAQVMATLRDLPGTVVQVLGWDEAFIGTDTDNPEHTARRAQTAVLEATSLHCSIGIGDTKIRAKIATDLAKPQGIFRLTKSNWFKVMGDRPTRAVWGIGAQTEKRLAALGATNVRELANLDEATLVAAFGPTQGPYIRQLGLGEGSSIVDDAPWKPQAHGRETTYQQDLTEERHIADAIRELADRVADDIKKERRPCARVHLKVRFAPFFTVTRSRKLPEPTYDPGIIADTAFTLLQGLEDARPIRLLGVRAEMTPPKS